MRDTLPIPNKPQNYPIIPAAFSEPKHPLILIADDRNNCAGLKLLLDLYGIDVLEAGSGEETIDFTVLKHPDLILINTNLPGIDGFETVRLIRAIKCFDKMPILFLSDETERAFRKRAFAVGGNGYYLRPLDIDRLDNLLENFLFRQN